MVAFSWATPSGDSTSGAGTDTYGSVVRASSTLWLALTQTSSSTISLRASEDDSGSWSTISLTAAPTGYTTSISIANPGIVVGDTYVAFVVLYEGTSGYQTAVFRRTISGTPTASWSRLLFTANRFRGFGLTWDGTGWLIAGNFAIPGITYDATHAYISASNPGGTWQTSGVFTPAGSTSPAIMRSIAYSSSLSRYAAIGVNSGGTTVAGYTGTARSTSVSWTSATPVSGLDRVQWVNGYFVAVGAASSSFAYSSDGITWSSHTPSGSLGNVYGIAHNATLGLWLLSTDAGLAYSSTLTGTYTLESLASIGISGALLASVLSPDGDEALALGSSTGLLRFSPGQSATAPRLLRQRQSPKRTPARVRGVDLRQRQTPFIR
jgi:hypothetical protein